jgi:hypothetical protein
MGRQLSGSLAVDGTDLGDVYETVFSEQRTVERETPMMARFCRYIEKVFNFAEQMNTLGDARKRPRIPTASLWASVFFLFVFRRGSLNAMESELPRPRRMERLIGTMKPSADRMGDIMGLMEPNQLRERLCRINHQLGRNKVFAKGGPWRFVAVDGHEFFFQQASVLLGMFSTKNQG